MLHFVCPVSCFCFALMTYTSLSLEMTEGTTHFVMDYPKATINPKGFSLGA